MLLLLDSILVSLSTSCIQRWSPRGRGLDLEAPRGWQLSASALALKLKSLALVLALASAFSLAYLISLSVLSFI